MTDGLPLRVFVATPGDLTSERAVVRTAIDEHNRPQTNDSARFEMAGGENVRGTARRPQEAINELIAECHFMIVMFRKSWGSEPGSPWGYTSGTEEELFTGLLQLGEDDRPLRDVWVGFLQDSAPDPKIIQLQEQMKSTHAMLYESASDTVELKRKLLARLDAWASKFGPKATRHISLIPSSGKDLLRASSLRRDGEKLVELGQPAAGRHNLQEAAVLGGPPQQLAYAKFLEHAGELDAAQAEIERVVDYFAKEPGTLQTPAAAEAFAALAGILRRKGFDVDAIGRLQQALTLLRGDDPYTSAVRCRISDELGLAHQKIGELAKARERFEHSQNARNKVGDEFGMCQSLVNFARLHMAEKDLDSAGRCAEDALLGLAGFPLGALHANAEVVRAQVLLRLGRAADAMGNVNRAIAINRQIGYARGEAISLFISAKCHKSLGEMGPAIEAAEKALAINEKIGDEAGMASCRWQIDDIGA
jgi:tetratricopeptide (TPR) repeat protein